VVSRGEMGYISKTPSKIPLFVSKMGTRVGIQSGNSETLKNIVRRRTKDYV